MLKSKRRTQFLLTLAICFFLSECTLLKAHSKENGYPTYAVMENVMFSEGELL